MAHFSFLLLVSLFGVVYGNFHVGITYSPELLGCMTFPVEVTMTCEFALNSTQFFYITWIRDSDTVYTRTPTSGIPALSFVDRIQEQSFGLSDTTTTLSKHVLKFNVTLCDGEERSYRCQVRQKAGSPSDAKKIMKFKSKDITIKDIKPPKENGQQNITFLVVGCCAGYESKNISVNNDATLSDILVTSENKKDCSQPITYSALGTFPTAGNYTLTVQSSCNGTTLTGTKTWPVQQHCPNCRSPPNVTNALIVREETKMCTIFYSNVVYRCDKGYAHNSSGSLNVTCDDNNVWSDSPICEDIDECLTQQCGVDAISNCTNTEGSYSCTCEKGYEEDTSQIPVCKDIDECQSNPCGDSERAYCTNTEGSYSCTCNEGYTKDTSKKTICQDIDECSTFEVCGGSSISECVNTEGSFACICKEGYINNTAELPGCQDINECETPEMACGRNDTSNCTNTVGSFSCTCANGYIKEISMLPVCQGKKTNKLVYGLSIPGSIIFVVVIAIILYLLFKRWHINISGKKTGSEDDNSGQQSRTSPHLNPHYPNWNLNTQQRVNFVQNSPVQYYKNQHMQYQTPSNLYYSIQQTSPSFYSHQNYQNQLKNPSYFDSRY